MIKKSKVMIPVILYKILMATAELLPPSGLAGEKLSVPPEPPSAPIVATISSVEASIVLFAFDASCLMVIVQIA